MMRTRGIHAIFFIAVVLLFSLSALAQDPCMRAEKLYGEARDEFSATDEGVMKMKEAVRLCPAEVKYWEWRAHQLYALDRYDEALGVIDEGLRLHPKDFSLHYLRALTLRDGKKLQDALDSALRARAYARDDCDKELARTQVNGIQQDLGMDRVILVGSEEVLKGGEMVNSVIHVKATVRPSVVFRNITFRLGSAELTETSYEQLQQIREALRSSVKEGDVPKEVILTGHCDRNPFKGKPKEESDELNQKLSLQRAEAAANWLAGELAGTLNRNVFQVYGKGFSAPVDPGMTPEADARNRRVEFRISLSKD
jgi:outer membrane protein OmpA-like peptidoglycan-associated protein